MGVPKSPPKPGADSNLENCEYVGVIADSRYDRVAGAIEAKYRHWDKVRFIARQEGLDPELLWAMVRLARMNHAKQLPLHGSNGNALTYGVPDAVLEELMLIDQQLAARLVSNDHQPFSTTRDESFVLSALREEAIASSMLEGAATTRRDAKRMLNERRSPKIHSE